MIQAATVKRPADNQLTGAFERRPALSQNLESNRKVSVDSDRYISTLRPDEHGRHESRTSCRDSGELSEVDKDAIYQQFRRGASVESLARNHLRTKVNIGRFINAMRVRRILELPLEFIPNPQFGDADADKTIMVDMASGDVPAGPTRIPAGLPPYLATLYEVALLTREQEGHLFRQFNYLKNKAAKLRGQLDSTRPKRRALDQIEDLHKQAVAVKNLIVRANLRLVVSIAKRYVGENGDLWELVSEGNMSLMRAVEKFDFARGIKISTYASWAIMRNFARSIHTEQRHRNRFHTSHEETFNASEEPRSDQYELESAQSQRAAQVQKILERLDEREKEIVVSRFGLEHGHVPQTLEKIGVKLGVSKERIRQIEARAMKKLRIAALDEHIEIEVPGTS